MAFRHVVEGYTLFPTLGDLRNRSVLDLGCGEGFYTRQFRRAGAAQVIGVDISGAMIELAQTEEQAQPIGCRYFCADAASYAPPARVDLVAAVYLLNYARTREELERLCRACFGALRPGGRMVGFNANVRRPPRPGESLAKYGFERIAERPLREGSPIRYRIAAPDGKWVEFDNYYLEPATYEGAMRNAGFTDFEWVDALTDPAESANPFWDDLKAQAPFTAFCASKSTPVQGDFQP